MRAALALLFLLNAAPALARCHSIWHYPWRQPNCATVVTARAWSVEITKPPPEPASEDPTREQAIEVLKQELRMRTTQALELQTLGLTMEEKRNGD
jgi:hypothetical protein